MMKAATDAAVATYQEQNSVVAALIADCAVQSIYPKH